MPLTPAQARADLERLIAGLTPRITQASADLVAGRINAAAWEIAIRDAIKPLHLAAALAGAGAPRPAQTVASAALRVQYRYLEGFRQDVRSGTQPLDGTLATRAAMYLSAARGTFAQAQRMVAPAGAEERRVLTRAEHCPECIAAAAAGWQPVGTLPWIGDSACLTRCQCYFQIRNSQEVTA